VSEESVGVVLCCSRFTNKLRFNKSIPDQIKWQNGMAKIFQIYTEYVFRLLTAMAIEVKGPIIGSTAKIT